jgi:hypothetical protein
MAVRANLQNRVTPAGDIFACPERGTMMGNRGGRIHGPDRQLLHKRWHSKQWICCVLAFKGRRRPVMAPNRYTELFFLDEATALSAGHRPCFECRREAATRFASLWNQTTGLPGRASVDTMDEQLQRERVSGGGKVIWQAPARELPDAAFVLWRPPGAAGKPLVQPMVPATESVPCMMLAKSLRPWSPAGYSGAVSVPANAMLDVLTPKSIVSVLGAGYRPVLHSSANA